MPIATGSQSTVGYMLEASYNVPDTGTVYNEIRRKSAAGLNLTKDSYDSEEVRIDRQLADSRHGVRRAGGDIETEVSVGSYTDLLGALLGYHDVGDTSGDFVKGWLDGSTVATTESIGFDSAGTIDFAAWPFKVGDRITVSGLVTNPTNNGTYTLTARFGATGKFYCSPSPAVTAAESGTATLLGYQAKVGRVSNSFTLERAFTDIVQYQAFTGMKVNSAAFTLPATGLATATWNFLGKDALDLAATPISTIATDPADVVNNPVYHSVSTEAVLAAVNGAIYIKQDALGTVTDLNFTIDNQLGGSEVVGSNVIPESLWGNTQMVSGKLTVLFEDEIQYNRFLNETTASLIFRMDGASAADWLQFTFPRCKFNSASIGDAVATDCHWRLNSGPCFLLYLVSIPRKSSSRRPVWPTQTCRHNF